MTESANLENLMGTYNNVRRVKPSVTLLAPDKNSFSLVVAAAKRCYSDLDNNELIRQVFADSEIDSPNYPKTVNFLGGVMNSGHLSVLEHANFTFAIEGVSRALLGQATRHRIESFSVQSQRYVPMDELMLYILPPSIEALGTEAVVKYAWQMSQMQTWYKEWLDLGIPPEDARFVTPQATETKYVTTVNARELLHFFSLRCCNRAQWEIHDMADQMLVACKNMSPEIFGKAGPACVMTGRCPEGKRTCGHMREVMARYTEMK